MPVDLAQRLRYADAVARADIETALLRHAKHGLPFLTALLELKPHFRPALESELTRIAGGDIHIAEPDPDLVARLPHGLCSQFLGFPVAVSGSSGQVDVLIADPLDTHAHGEFSFHLQAKVRLLRGSLSFLNERLVALEGGFAASIAQQELEGMNDTRPASVADSAPPIPLVRLAPQVDTAPPMTAAPHTRPGVAPPAQEVTLGAQRGGAVPAPSEVDAQRSVAALLEPSTGESSFQAALGELAIAESPESVVNSLVVGLSSLCEEVVVLATRGSVLRSRCRANRYGEPEKYAEAELSTSAPSCAASALQSEQFLGPAVEADSLIFAMPSNEVSATAVKVAGKIALVVCISGFGNAYEATRRADHLSRSASDALSRIVLLRKR